MNSTAPPLISIVIAYGRRKTALLQCLESLRAGGFTEEIVVVDMYNDQLYDTGFDFRYLALKAEPSEVFHKSRCLNHGIQQASGKYVSIIDCDMIVCPGWYEGIRQMLHPTQVITTRVIKHNATETGRFLNGEIDRAALIKSGGQICRFGCSQITVLREHLLRRPYREIYRGWGAEDSDMNLELSKSLLMRDLDHSLSHHHLYHDRPARNDFYKTTFINRNRKLYAQARASIGPRIGIYVAAYNSSATLESHLERIHRFTEMAFDYYIADNSTDPAEKHYFRETIARYPFATVIESPHTQHGDTLQYMVDVTANEIIVLFDVDCFPLKPWDSWALERLQSKVAVGILSHVATREIDYHLHPSFMMFRRSLLADNRLDLRSGHIPRSSRGKLRNLDPAGKITTFLQAQGRFNSHYVEALLPTAVEVAFQEPFAWEGRKNLRRGFGVTYEDRIFHFWFSRHFQNLQPIYDDQKRLVVDPPTIRKILDKYTVTDALPHGAANRIKERMPVPKSFSTRSDILPQEKPKPLDAEIFRATTAKNAPRIDLLMLTYERLDYTMMTLESLRDTDCGIDWSWVRFTVIDNDSNDDTVERVRNFCQKHPGIIDRLVKTGSNLGAEGGLIHYVRNYAGDAPFIGKIDNDSIFTGEWLKRLLECIEGYPELGIVGAQEEPGQGQHAVPVINSAGLGYYPAPFVGGRFLARRTVFANMLSRRFSYTSWTKYQKSTAIQFRSGWCIPEAVIEHVGDWEFRHPKAIKTPAYFDYYRKTGRAKQMVFPK